MSKSKSRLTIALLLTALCSACSGTTTVAPRVKLGPNGEIEVGVEIGVTRVKVTKTTSETLAVAGPNDATVGGVGVTTVTTELVVETSTTGGSP